MTSLGSSQTLLNDSTCCVPCSTLRNALLLKAKYQYTLSQLEVARDSIDIMIDILSYKDLTIIAKDSTISLHEENEKSFMRLVNNKDQEIDLWKKEAKKQKRHKRIAYGISIGTLILGTIIAL